AVCRNGRGVWPGLAGRHDGWSVAVVPGRDASAVADDLARRTGRDTGPVGAAGPAVPAAGLRDAYAEARRTADALTALGLTAGSARDLGFAGLVTGEAADVEG